MPTPKWFNVTARPAKALDDGTWESTWWFGENPERMSIEASTVPEFMGKLKAALAMLPATALPGESNAWNVTIKPASGRWAPGFKARLAPGLWLRTETLSTA